MDPHRSAWRNGGRWNVVHDVAERTQGQLEVRDRSEASLHTHRLRGAQEPRVCRANDVTPGTAGQWRQVLEAVEAVGIGVHGGVEPAVLVEPGTCSAQPDRTVRG